MGNNDRVNACPELDFPHTSLWCGGCHSRQQTSRIANALEDLVSFKNEFIELLSTEQGKLEMNIHKEQKKYIPPPPREARDRYKFKGLEL